MRAVSMRDALVLLFAAVSHSLSTPVFFDTNGRLQRGATPGGGQRRYVPVHDGLSLLEPHGDGGWRPALLAPEEVERDDAGCIEAFLGTVAEGVLAADAGQVDYYLLDVSHLPAAPALGAAEAVWAPLRARAGPSPCDTLECDEAALLGTAAGMAQWHRSVTFCAQCGSADVKPYREGKGRQCAVCKARFRPRLDASIIVLVTDRKGERCLLGRSARWPEGRYSTLAGFLEFGETLEECVVREVEEEAGRRAHVGPPAPIIVLTMHLPCTYHALTMHVICAYYLPTMWLLLCTCSRTRGQGRPRLPPLRRIAAMALPALDDGGVHRAGRGRGRGRAAAG